MANVVSNFVVSWLTMELNNRSTLIIGKDEEELWNAQEETIKHLSTPRFSIEQALNRLSLVLSTATIRYTMASKVAEELSKTLGTVDSQEHQTPDMLPHYVIPTMQNMLGRKLHLFWLTECSNTAVRRATAFLTSHSMDSRDPLTSLHTPAGPPNAANLKALLL